MGNQGHSNEGARQLCEMVWAGEIGAVREVHAWTDRPVWPQGLAAPLGEEAAPDGLDWDIWLGPASARPYSSGYAPFKWRGWYDFGSGALGDMACHILDPANWALQLRAPSSIEVVRQERKNDYTFPVKALLRFEFPARGSMPPVNVYWYEGGARPASIGPDLEFRDMPNGSVLIGDKGIAATGPYGEYVRLLPDERMNGYRFPNPILSRSPGHYRDWIRACKGGEAACSNFDYAAPFTEWVLLGVIALRTGGTLDWDSRKMKFIDNPAANRYLHRHCRKGWKV
jgi:predicted dehydrogenase